MYVKDGYKDPQSLSPDMEKDQVFPRTRFVNNQNLHKKYISKFLTITRIIVEIIIHRLWQSMPNIQFLSRNVHIYKVLFQNNSKQDLGRNCSAWKDFGLGLEISLHSSLRDRVKWDLGLGVNCLREA